jgi:RNA polymerase sporulation-specific sigma factor
MFSYLFGVLQNLLFFVLHVQGVGSFPRALSAAEERELICKMEAGDEAARAGLIEHNLRLVAHVVKKYYAASGCQDDLISIGTIGLIKAVGTFNSKKGIRLATYAARCIENEILMYFRASKKTAQDVFINDPIDSDKDGNPLTLLDIIATEDNIADDIDLKIKIGKLHRFVDRLAARERRIIRLRYGLGGVTPLTQREVADRLRISRSYVSRLEKKALEELYRMFEGGQ